MKHTSEPWMIKERPDGWGNCTVMVGGNNKTVFFALYPTNLEDWNRVVACVNAMAGKEDPNHFVKMGENYIQQDKDIREVINAHPEESTFDEVVRLKSQHAQLIEALQFCQSVIKSQGMFELSERMAYDKAEAAIQKANSKKP